MYRESNRRKNKGRKRGYIDNSRYLYNKNLINSRRSRRKARIVAGIIGGTAILAAIILTAWYCLGGIMQTDSERLGEQEGAGEGMWETGGEEPGESVSGNDVMQDFPAQEPETAKQTEAAERPCVRGIYVTGPVAGSSERMEELIGLVDATELNTMVIDVKNDNGEITWKMDLDQVESMGNGVRYIGDIEELLARLKEHGIYTIARIICFKDPALAEKYPEYALRLPNGRNLTDGYGLAWVNPYKEGVWEYLADVAEAAAEVGFDEVQFDYVRFPIGEEANVADYGVDVEDYPKEKAIVDFLSYVRERLGDSGVPVTADVFGTVIGSDTDIERVGQNYTNLGRCVDVLSPMVYPSHYAAGVFGYDVPDAHPYEIVYRALQMSVEDLDGVDEEERATVRPWLQAFTATWVDGHISYGGDQIRQQIQAVYDAGYEEWILWNSASRYTAEGLEPALPFAE